MMAILMPVFELLPMIALVAVALIASVLSAVTGFGGAVILLPVVVWVFGVRDAVPILTVAQLIGNLARAYFNRDELAWSVTAWFSVGAVPASVLGALLFVSAPVALLTRLLGVFLLGTVAYPHTKFGQQLRITRSGFLGVGALLGFLSALLGSVGPLAAPFFLSYGLVSGAYIGTEASTAVVMHLVKVVVYGRFALLDLASIATGLAIGVVLIVGSYVGKRLLVRVPTTVFPQIVEAVLIVSGLQLLVVGS